MMHHIKKKLQCLLCVLFFALPFHAAAQQADSAFVVEDIRIEGLQRVSPGVIFNVLPVGVGDTLLPEQAAAVIAALYETGHFREVDVLRDGGVLVVEVKENPTIAEVTTNGIDELSEERVTEMLNSAGIAQSKIFNQSVVEQARRVLENVYVERNYYHAKVEAVVSPLSRNRVAILFDVDEGDEAYIRSIRIEGNELFSARRLRGDMQMQPRRLFNYFSDNHRYSDDKLEAGLARIRTRYLEAGYLRFEVEASQVEVSSDKEAIDIIIQLNEGVPFRVSGTRFVSGGRPLPADVDVEDLEQYATQKPGDIYSGLAAAETVSKLREHLGNLGYSFAQVGTDIDINDEEATAEVIYIISPRKAVYVRRINIVGNEITADDTIRRELLQYETEKYSQAKVDSSRGRVRRLGYFNRVDIETVPVPGNDQLVDLLVRVEEANTGQVRLGGGFGSDGGFTYNFSFSNTNIFGTGNDFSASFSKSDDAQSFNFLLNERYYTKSGITRHISMGYHEAQSSEDTSPYDYDSYRVAYGYSFPFADEGSYRAYLAYEEVTVNFSLPIRDYAVFTNEHGTKFDSLNLDFGFTYDNRDAANLPRNGYRLILSGEYALPSRDLRYYRATYLYDYYADDVSPGIIAPLTDSVFHLRLGGGFGDKYSDGQYPFYKRFFVGGVNSLRGFKANSVGYAVDFRGDAVGGKSNFHSSAELAVPVTFFEAQQIFFVPFTDSGGVGGRLTPKSFRSSAGFEMRWISPVGPLRFSYAWPIAKWDGDKTQEFQFSLSTF